MNGRELYEALTADTWLAGAHPDQPPLPDPDRTGRLRGEVGMTETTLGQVIHGDRTERGGHRQPLRIHLQAIADHPDTIEAEERARALAIAANECQHCHAGEITYPDLAVCHPCYQYAHRTGRLPGELVLRRRRQRIASTSYNAEAA